MAKKRILLIDDEVGLCKVMKLNVERAGEYEVTMAFSGEEGLRLAKETAFDLVITDVIMPGMDGHDVLKTLKQRRPGAPVVLFSAYHDDPTTITADLLREADGMIIKPLDHQQLVDTIERALSRRSA